MELEWHHRFGAQNLEVNTRFGGENVNPLTKYKSVRFLSKYELQVLLHAHFGKHTLFTHTSKGTPFLATAMHSRAPANSLYLPHNSHRWRYLWLRLHSRTSRWQHYVVTWSQASGPPGVCKKQRSGITKKTKYVLNLSYLCYHSTNVPG
jgi:hypothetical protein